MLTDPASIAWLLNIRGGDVPFTPFALGFALIARRRRAPTCSWTRPSCPTRRAPGSAMPCRSRGREALAPALAGLAGKRVRVDAAGSPVWFAQTLRDAGAPRSSPAPTPACCRKPARTTVEQQGARAAHRRDAVAVCRFLHFLVGRRPGGSETEMSAADRLLAFRREVAGFRGESFPAISGAGEHGAIIHYRVTEETRPADPTRTRST